MRTSQEIADYYKTVAHEDVLGFTADVLLPFLPYELAKPFLSDKATPEKWAEAECPVRFDRESVLAEMKDYMEFAWEKALGHRGISASRSVDKMKAWVFVLGDDFPIAPYPQYGAPILRALCEKYITLIERRYFQ